MMNTIRASLHSFDLNLISSLRFARIVNKVLGQQYTPDSLLARHRVTAIDPFLREPAVCIYQNAPLLAGSFFLTNPRLRSPPAPPSLMQIDPNGAPCFIPLQQTYSIAQVVMNFNMTIPPTSRASEGPLQCGKSRLFVDTLSFFFSQYAHSIPGVLLNNPQLRLHFRGLKDGDHNSDKC